jgi:hypothetical protein
MNLKTCALSWSLYSSFQNARTLQHNISNRQYLLLKCQCRERTESMLIRCLFGTFCYTIQWLDQAC